MENYDFFARIFARKISSVNELDKNKTVSTAFRQMFS